MAEGRTLSYAMPRNFSKASRFVAGGRTRAGVVRAGDAVALAGGAWGLGATLATEFVGFISAARATSVFGGTTAVTPPKSKSRTPQKTRLARGNGLDSS